MAAGLSPPFKLEAGGAAGMAPFAGGGQAGINYVSVGPDGKPLGLPPGGYGALANIDLRGMLGVNPWVGQNWRGLLALQSQADCSGLTGPVPTAAGGALPSDLPIAGGQIPMPMRVSELGS